MCAAVGTTHAQLPQGPLRLNFSTPIFRFANAGCAAAKHGLCVIGAINDEFADWNADLSDGDAVVFIPPVAGG